MDKFKPTQEWMRKWYTVMNSQLFGNSLGDCILDTFTTGKGSSGHVLGVFSITGNNIKIVCSNRSMIQDNWGVRTYINRNNFVSLCRPTIKLNANYSATEDAWLNTLVHEMCHYYTYMYGIAPKQPHGVEFKHIANIVASRSNGKITIQRLASAEEMQNYELDADVQAKNMERKNRKFQNASVLVIVTKTSQVRLLITTSSQLIKQVYDNHYTLNNITYFGVCKDSNLVENLVSQGYNNFMRTYKYWDITANAKLHNELVSYSWNKIGGTKDTLIQALFIDNVKPIKKEKEEESNNLGFKIIEDGSGYNLMTQGGNKTFAKPMEKIWFDKDINLYRVKNGKFMYHGVPGKWVKDDNDITESNKQNNNNKILITIDGYMNLGIDSPFEEITENEYHNDVIKNLTENIIKSLKEKYLKNH